MPEVIDPKVPLDEAKALIPNETHIHTYRSTSAALIGAHWEREDLLKVMEQYGVELSGPMATGMDHGLVLFDNTGPLFIETDFEALNQFHRTRTGGSIVNTRPATETTDGNGPGGDQPHAPGSSDSQAPHDR